uniref:Uncharacterized protein n=1 Tax=viral metagenome TaxID=1070528 RepID=A0A6C0CLL7_9ZZZZ
MYDYNELRWEDGKMVHLEISSKRFRYITTQLNNNVTKANVDIYHQGFDTMFLYDLRPSHLYLSAFIDTLTINQLKHFAKYTEADLVHFTRRLTEYGMGYMYSNYI